MLIFTSLRPSRSIKYLIVFSIFQGLYLSSKAGHIVGAFLEYDCVEPGVYEVTLNVFQDCFDDLVTEDVNIRVVPDCDFNFFSTNLPILSNEDITDVCESQVSNTLCQEGLLASYRLVRYRGIVNVTTDCESFRFMWKINYRGNGDNITDENWVFYTHTIVYPGNAPCNNSPKVSEPNVPVTCLNSQGSIDMGITENEGDSLQFSLTSLLHSPAGITFAPLTYADGFDFLNPIPGALLNVSTGRFDYDTGSQGRYFISIKVDEYNEQGVLLSQMHVDFLIVNVTCTDSGLGAGDEELHGLTEGVSSNGPLFIEVCQNQSFCGELVYSVGSDDLNIEVLDNLQQVLNDAEVILLMETDSVRLRFCGTSGPTAGMAQLQFLLSDDHCPYSNEVWTAIDLIITDGSAPEVFIEFFGGELSMTNPEAGQSYQWYQDNEAVPGATSSTFSEIQEGSDYHLVVSNSFGCTGISNTLNIGTVGTIERVVPTFHLSPNPSGELLTIELDATRTANPTRGEIRDLSGRVAIEFYLVGRLHVLDVNDLKPGMYQLTLYLDGEYSSSRSFVKL